MTVLSGGNGKVLDDPQASVLQKPGLGSIIYIFCLSFFIWLILLSFYVRPWKYFTDHT
ncbi:MAG TPA: hypothetical protein VD996_00890 [Chitinophagaceae bacterium]|nr:hypothetical protein [Chitinophagaceae bacterium]